MTPQERFQKAVLRGMAASPSGGVVVLIYGSTRHTCKGCIVASGDNKAKADEFGLEHQRTLDVHIPKTALPRKPGIKDLIEYQDRRYTLNSIKGDDALSPVWVVSATAPL